MSKFLGKYTPILFQFIKFGIIGVSNTIISYVIYIIALKMLEVVDVSENVSYLYAQGISFLLSVAWSYYWNNRFVFTNSKNTSWIKVLLKTYVAYSFTGLFLSSALLVVWIQYLGISEYIAPIINLLFTVPINFLINKFWAFASER